MLLGAAPAALPEEGACGVLAGADGCSAADADPGAANLREDWSLLALLLSPEVELEVEVEVEDDSGVDGDAGVEAFSSGV